MKIFLLVSVFLVVLTGALPAQESNLTGSVDLNEAIVRAARGIEEALPQGARVAVIGFDSPSERFSDYVVDELAGELAGGRKVAVMDNRSPAPAGGETMQAAGRRLGAQSVISGALTNSRFRIRSINVETGAIQAQITLELQNDAQTAFLLSGRPPNTPPIAAAPPRTPPPAAPPPPAPPAVPPPAAAPVAPLSAPPTELASPPVPVQTLVQEETPEQGEQPAPLAAAPPEPAPPPPPAAGPGRDRAARLNTLGVSMGTSFADPAIIATVRGTFDIGRYWFMEAGLDLGLVSMYNDVEAYYSLYPFTHIGVFAPFRGKGGWYIGAGGGYMAGEYTFALSGGKVPVSVLAADFITGFNFGNVFDISYTVRTNFSSFSNKLSMGFVKRF